MYIIMHKIMNIRIILNKYSFCIDKTKSEMYNPVQTGRNDFGGVNYEQRKH